MLCLIHHISSHSDIFTHTVGNWCIVLILTRSREYTFLSLFYKLCIQISVVKKLSYSTMIEPAKKCTRLNRIKKVDYKCFLNVDFFYHRFFFLAFNIYHRLKLCLYCLLIHLICWNMSHHEYKNHLLDSRVLASSARGPRFKDHVIPKTL